MTTVTFPFNYSQSYFKVRARNPSSTTCLDVHDVLIRDVHDEEVQEVHAFGSAVEEKILDVGGRLMRVALDPDGAPLLVADLPGLLGSGSTDYQVWRDYPFHDGTPRAVDPESQSRMGRRVQRGGIGVPSSQRTRVLYGSGPRAATGIQDEVRSFAENDREAVVDRMSRKAETLAAWNGFLLVPTSAPVFRIRETKDGHVAEILSAERLAEEFLLYQAANSSSYSYSRDLNRRRQDVLILPASSSGYAVRAVDALERSPLVSLEVADHPSDLLSFSDGRIHEGEYERIVKEGVNTMASFANRTLADFRDHDAITRAADVLDRVGVVVRTRKTDEAISPGALQDAIDAVLAIEADGVLKRDSGKALHLLLLRTAAPFRLDADARDEADMEALDVGAPQP